MNFKKTFSSIAIAIGIALLGAAPVQALPSTTSWIDAGLNEMVRFTGPLTTSISGKGFTGRTGTIDVQKPAGGTVLAAYLTSTSNSNLLSDGPNDLKINGQLVTYSHIAKTTVNWGFSSYFAEVTNLVKSDIDAASAGIVSIPLDEGTNYNNGSTDGEELVVIFNDPAKTNNFSSVVIVFGSARQAGDTFTMNFPALTDLSTQSATLSLGIGYSMQTPSNRAQHSEVKIATSSATTPVTVTQTAGGSDDGSNQNGALITVGGIGDSLDVPALNSTANDDELYGLNSFLVNGDSSITIQTFNSSLDDNVFQAVLVLEGVVIDGAVPLGVASQSSNSVTPSTEINTLANTGMRKSLFQASIILGFSLIILGGFMVFARKMTKE